MKLVRAQAAFEANIAATRAAPAGLIEQLPLPVAVFDAEDRFTYVSPAAEEFFQSSLSRLAGKRLDQYIPTDHPLLALMGQVRRTGRSANLIGLDVASPRIGEHRDVEVHAARFSEGEGAVLVTLQERSTARLLERQMGRRSAGRSVSGLAGVIAHEIRNPLAGIRGAAQLLESGVDSEGRALTRLICSEIDRVAGLLDRMLDFGDGPVRASAAVNIHSVLDHVRRLAEAGSPKSLRFAVEFDPSLPSVLGDRDRLVQAMLNLVKNAVEAASSQREGAQVWLRTKFQAGVAVTNPANGQRVSLPLVITVEDNGPGIAEEIVNNLFEPFVTNKPAGTGLGLALSARIVGEHGGLIETERVRGRTVFRVMLPMAPAGVANSGDHNT
jgi:two-component system, NtrC family, nitrogen regulation sensor histidine kinase GlnL